ncbi:MAG TPA: transglycosylase [Actinomycetales bacterium]|nr:transglycosylase [Actinomycetales bacterium]
MSRRKSSDDYAWSHSLSDGPGPRVRRIIEGTRENLQRGLGHRDPVEQPRREWRQEWRRPDRDVFPGRGADHAVGKHPRFRRLKKTGKAVVAVTVVMLLYFASLNVRAPGSTAFMRANEADPVIHEWVDIDHMSRYLIAGAIVHEDSRMGERFAPMDYGAFVDRARAHLHNNGLGCGADDTYHVVTLDEATAGNLCMRDPSGSTIPVQLIKNLYLSPDGGAFRKGLEFALVHPFNLVVSDERILEMYLNYAQFAPDIYGVCAAHWYYFGTPPHESTPTQAGMLAGMLPLPSEVRRAPEGGPLLTGDGSRVERSIQWGGIDRVAPEVAGDGWLRYTSTIGIEGTAGDHAADRGRPGSCSTMPQEVRDKLIDEGFAV